MNIISFPKFNTIKMIQQQSFTPVKQLYCDTVSFHSKQEVNWQPQIDKIRMSLETSIEKGEKPSFFSVRLDTKIATHICEKLINETPELKTLWQQLYPPKIKYTEAQKIENYKNIKIIINNAIEKKQKLTIKQLSEISGLTENEITRIIHSNSYIKGRWNLLKGRR